MRRLLLALALALAVVLGAGASAAQAVAPPEDGFVVYKELRGRAVTEVRDARGRFLFSEVKSGGSAGGGPACLDPRHAFFGPRWRGAAPSFLVNALSMPAYLDREAAAADLVAGNQAWQSPYTTDCPFTFAPTSYGSSYGGDTDLGPSLLELAADGVNVVAFRSLAGTMCDGAVACTVIDYDRGRIGEADVIFEPDLARYGYDDRWTTDDTTAIGATSGLFAVIDVATHEFGHFAGLDHVEKSPGLTMYPLIHDGMQTLGLGDLKGLAARY